MKLCPSEKAKKNSIVLWGKWFALKWKTTIFRFYNSPSSTCDDKFLSSVLFWFQQRRSIYCRVYMYREISEKKTYSSFLRKCVSWLFRIPRILIHITAFHSLVKRSDFYLPFLLLFVFFWMCGNDQNSLKKRCLYPIWEEEQEYFFRSGPVTRVKSFL